jgi:hypothetical protein
MFLGNCNITRKVLNAQEAMDLVEAGVTPCLNPSHQATIDAMVARFGIKVGIPETPPKVELRQGDSVIVMGVRGLPRLTDRHEYTAEEIGKANFAFALYTVTEA